jgi:Dockerin type I domain
MLQKLAKDRILANTYSRPSHLYKFCCHIRRTTPMLFVVAAIFHSGPRNCYGYRIEFSRNLAGGSEYQTNTITEANYDAWYGNGATGVSDLSVPSASDLNFSPILMGEPNHPITAFDGKTGKLSVLTPKPHQAVEGKVIWGNDSRVFQGIADMSWNIGGTFRIIPEDGERQTGWVFAEARGAIRGLIGVNPHERAQDVPTSGLEGRIFIQGLGEQKIGASIRGSASAGSTNTLNSQFELSLTPGVTLGGAFSGSNTRTINREVQPRRSVHLLPKKLPLNKDIAWNLMMQLTADNKSQEEFVSAAWAWLTGQYVNISVIGNARDRRTGYRSDAAHNYDHRQGMLQLRHPQAPAGTIITPRAAEPNGEDASNGELVSFHDKQAEIEEIFANYVSTEPESDPMYGAILSYSPIYFHAFNDDGTASFENSMIYYFDQLDPENLLGTARLTGILADIENESFTANIVDFNHETLAVGSSPLADALTEYGGRVQFDPEIMFDTDFFSASAESAPYPVLATVLVPDADVNGDSLTDGNDFLAIQRGFGTLTGATVVEGDTNYDGEVNGFDIAQWIREFGGLSAQPNVAAATAIPEPATIMLLTGGGIAMLIGARRQMP